jgi:arsenate reductase-like glutaredoxin family protein
METDIESKTEWPEVLRTLEATYRRLSERVLELNERTIHELTEDDLERIERVEALLR